MTTDPGIKAPKSAIGLVIAAMNGLGALLIVAITLLICADIIGRSLFNKPVAGVAEMVSLTIVAIVFLQIGQTVREDGLAYSDVFTSAVARKSARAHALLRGVYMLIAALLFAALLYGSWSKLLDTWSSDEHVGVYGLFVAPVWPVSLVVVLGSVAALIQFLIHAVQYLHIAVRPPSQDSGDT